MIPKAFGPAFAGLCFLVIADSSTAFDSGCVAASDIGVSIDSEIFKSAADLIDSARFRINVEMYTFQQKSLAKKLAEKKKQGVIVRVILDVEPEGNEQVRQFLLEQGIDTRYFPKKPGQIDHMKIVVADNRGMVSGANWGLHSPENHDVAVSFSGDAVKCLNRIFEDDWRLSKIEKPVPEAEKTGEISGKCDCPDGTIRILSDRDIRREIVRQIRQAKQTIFVSMFTFTDNHLLKLLSRAAKKGKDVRIILDPGQECNGLTTKLMKQYKIPVRLADVQPGRLLHMKLGIFDGRTSVLGSANWTLGGFNVNHECVLVTREMKVLKRLMKMFESDWAKAGKQ